MPITTSGSSGPRDIISRTFAAAVMDPSRDLIVIGEVLLLLSVDINEFSKASKALTCALLRMLFVATVLWLPPEGTNTDGEACACDVPGDSTPPRCGSAGRSSAIRFQWPLVLGDRGGDADRCGVQEGSGVVAFEEEGDADNEGERERMTPSTRLTATGEDEGCGWWASTSTGIDAH